MCKGKKDKIHVVDNVPVGLKNRISCKKIIGLVQ